MTRESPALTDVTGGSDSRRPAGLLLKVFSLYGGALLIGMVLVSVPASSVYLKAIHGFSDQQYGTVFLGQLAFAIVGALLAGPAVMRMSLRNMYGSALLCLLVAQLCLALSNFTEPRTALLLITLALSFFGFGFGFGGGPLNGLVCLVFPDRTNSAITALHMMAGAGLMIGPLYFRAFEANSVWLLGPVVLIGVAALLFITTGAALQNDRPHISRVEEGKNPPSRSGYFWLMIVIAFLYALVEGTFANWAIIFVSEVKGLSANTAATSLASFWGGLTLGRLVVTLLVVRVKPLVIWSLLPAAMMVALWLLPQVATDRQAIAGFAFAGLTCSAFFPLMVALAAEPFPHAVSWIASMLTAALMCGVGVGSYLVGSFIGELELRTLYRYAMVYPVLILLLIFYSRIITRPLMERQRT